jgi:hypothetical protein
MLDSSRETWHANYEATRSHPYGIAPAPALKRLPESSGTRR